MEMIAPGLHILGEFKLLSSICRSGTISYYPNSRPRLRPGRWSPSPSPRLARMSSADQVIHW